MSTYNASNIGVLEGLEAVRKRSGMYIGDPSKAIFQMILECVDNCVDEHSIGYGDLINFSYENGIYSVEDRGRGIPVDMHEKGLPAVEIILTTLHSGGKFDENSYKYSGGLHGVGVSVVNALSEYLIVEVARNGKKYRMKFEVGKTVEPLEEIGTADYTGTKVIFKPDSKILTSDIPTKEEIRNRFKELTYLNKNLTINFKYEKDETETIKSSGGIKDLNAKMGKPIHKESLYFVDETNEICFFWSDKESDNEAENVMCFTNNIFQIDGGTHLTGFRLGLCKVIIPYVEQYISSGKSKVQKVLNEDIKGGLKAVVSIKIQEPKFSSQTKNKLVSTEARGQVESFVIRKLSDVIEKNPDIRELIIKKIVANAYVRENMSRVKESIKKMIDIDPFSALPGKLSDCQENDPALSELFIVEGDSAGGSAKQGRYKKNQAVLALRGKPLNVERALMHKSLSCDPIVTLIAALGTGVGNTFNLNKLRYHKVIIMTDADPDGWHIRCLLITFFLKLMPDLVRQGNVFIAKTPLYKISHGKNNKYLQNQEELDQYLLNKFINNNEVKDQNGNILSKSEIIELLKECKDFKKFVHKHSLVVDKKILSLALVYDAFNKPDYFIDKVRSIIDGEVLVEKTNDGIDILVNSIYGKSKYYIEDHKINWSMDIFPLFINGDKCYNPIDFLKIYDKKIMSGISIQRYKGLGEMNPEELKETSLDPENRLLEKLVTEDMEESIGHMVEIMGNENNRRSFVLSHLKEMFGYRI